MATKDATTTPDGDPAEALRQFWNSRYAAEAYAYGTAPNDFLAAQAAQLRALRAAAGDGPAPRALCLADGEGRNGVWLAGQGFEVWSVDLADAGLAKARALAQAQGVSLHTEAADVTRMDLGERRWSLIVSIFLHLPGPLRRALHHRCAAALAPGGLFVFEAYTPQQLALGTGGPKEPQLLPTLDEVQADFADFTGGVATAPTVSAAANAADPADAARNADADVSADLPRLDTLHAWSGERPVVEGRLHSGTGHVAQLLLRRR